jgi:hypothetical protein
VGFVGFGIPTNEDGEDEADLELSWNISLLYHVASRLEALIELSGEEIFGGDEDGTSIVDITPGLKVAPFDGQPAKLGIGVSLPLSNDKEFDVRMVLSAFYHF